MCGLLVFSTNSWNVTKTKRKGGEEKMPAGREEERNRPNLLSRRQFKSESAPLPSSPLSVSENHSLVSLPHR